MAETTDRPLYAVVAGHNVASVRVLEKCGFVHAGAAADPPDAHGTVVEVLLMVLRESRF